MMDAFEAIRFAQERFPNGPEELAKHLGIDVHCVPLTGCDGWCVRRGSRAIIRINKSVPVVRQRFTLAHELLHIVLDTSTDVSEFEEGSCLGNSNEEVINNLSSVMLLPKEQVLSRLGESRPITRHEIESIAGEARLSEIAVVMRLVRMSDELKLKSTYVALFLGGKFKWMCPPMAASQSTVIELANSARLTAPNPFIRETAEGVETSLVIHTPYSDTLFVQVIGRPSH
jgi:hypothetical protein